MIEAVKLYGDRTKAAFKALGGRAKAIYWHMGVAKALETVGFRFVGGRREGDAPREYGGNIFNPIVGSSSGAMWACFVAAGFSIDEMLAYKVEPHHIFRKTGWKPIEYLKRVARTTAWRTGRRFRPWDVRPRDLMAIRARYSTDGLARFLENDVLARASNRFEELACEFYVLATELDHPRTVVFGEKSLPQGSDYDYEYGAGVPISEATAASMAIPPIFQPVPIRYRDKRVYFMDGELRDPFVTHVAEDTGADLVVVSSVYQAFEFMEEYGSLFESGLPGIYPQTREQSLHAKQVNAIYNRRRTAQAIAYTYGFARRYLPEEVARKLVEEMERRLDCRRHNVILYITPEHDAKVYRIHPFDLSERARRIVVRRGYERTMEVLIGQGYIDAKVPFEDVVKVEALLRPTGATTPIAP